MSNPSDPKLEEFFRSQQQGNGSPSPRPFSRPPVGSKLGAIVVLVLFVGIYVAIRIASWLSLPRH